MSFLASLLQIPRWLERAWQETRVDAPDTRPAPPEEETVPLPLHGWLERRR